MLTNHVQVHNIQDQQNVVRTNYELEIRRKYNLPTVSRNIVSNTSHLLVNCNKNSTNFKEEAKETKDLQVNWNTKMKDLLNFKLKKL